MAIEKYIIDKSDLTALLRGECLAIRPKGRIKGFCVEIVGDLTNGDVIKAVFPNAKIDEIKRFKDYPETRVIWEGLIAMCPTFWWNEPYKVGDTE